jgi:hypothetical protein
MFVVTEAEATAIRTQFEQRGELSAVIELRRLLPGIADATDLRALVDVRRDDATLSRLCPAVRARPTTRGYP